MFVDYITLLLINMVAGYFLLSAYVAMGLDDPLDRRWVPGFAMVGFVAFAFGLHMTLTWPVPGPYSSAYGEMSVLFGLVFLGAAAAIARGWSLASVTVFAFFAGVAAVVLGFRIIDLELTQTPVLAGVGFILSGAAGVFATPTLLYLRENRPYRAIAALVVLVPAAIWAFIGYHAYWGHMESFAQWTPVAMRAMGPG
jgi:putative membrane protein